jgi:2-polyprenyl-3-methyl-5-hydroxy-6-metoxy-1,4-benzoquinol methylase
MRPEETGRSYDTLAESFQAQMRGSTYGVAAYESALQFVVHRGHALDIGCGSSARLIDLLVEKGFIVEGIDVSEKMIELARQQRPAISFQHADICTWTLPREYDFIAAWDSIWHLPLAEQDSVMRKICEGLTPGGVFLFTTAGLDEPTEKQDSNMGVPAHYSLLGIPRTLALLADLGCVCRHLEYDQYPEKHLVVIAQRN